MNIKIPHSLLLTYLKTNASPEEIAKCLTLCGPSIDRLTKIDKDYIYEVEVITNRIDSVSAFGLAREACAILPQFGYPSSLKNNPYTTKYVPVLSEQSLPLHVQVLDQSLIPRFTAIILKNLTVSSVSPTIKNQLELSGSRTLNNLIDITNYLTLSLGQPVHIFDYDKIQGAIMKIRCSKKGEQITTLDHKTHLLKGGDIVIEDGSGKLIDLCGIMGGLSSEVDENTKRAILFVQTYRPEKIRTTSLYTQERTLAAQIFEKHPDPELVLPTLYEGIKLLASEAGAEIAGNIIDIYPNPVNSTSLTLDLNWVQNIIGTSLTPRNIKHILDPLGFHPVIAKKQLTVTVPSWRSHDISIKEDIVEEIARVYGYFKLPGVLPPTTCPLTQDNHVLANEYQAKNFFSLLGFTEIYNFSLISPDLMEKCHLSLEHSIKLQNPLSIDFSLMRRSLIPGLLKDLCDNKGKQDLPIKIFELSNIYLDSKEPAILAGLIYGGNFPDTKGILEAFFDYLHLPDLRFLPLDEDSLTFEVSRTANIFSGNTYLGLLGAIDRGVLHNFGLTDDCILWTLDFETVSSLSTSIPKIILPSPYATIIEDITISSSSLIGEIMSKIKNTSLLITGIQYLTSFKDKHTFKLSFNSNKTNLTQKEVDKIKCQINLLSAAPVKN